MAKKISGWKRNYITKLARIAVAYLVRNCQKQICLLKELLYQIALARIVVASVVRKCCSLEFMSQFFWRTTTKNKKLLVGGIQSESSRSNCHVANLDTTTKKTQCDGWKYQKAFDRIVVATFV